MYYTVPVGGNTHVCSPVDARCLKSLGGGKRTRKQSRKSCSRRLAVRCRSTRSLSRIARRRAVSGSTGSLASCSTARWCVKVSRFLSKKSAHLGKRLPGWGGLPKCPTRGGMTCSGASRRAFHARKHQRDIVVAFLIQRRKTRATGGL